MIETIKEIANFFINTFSLFVTLLAENAIKILEFLNMTSGGGGGSTN